ncbi:hypothetical protein ON010_g3473 [Phytophthora cinnamomi]|nr:hypothetical protein ON010_g3473 [Phytophthora cinnamomi]
MPISNKLKKAQNKRSSLYKFAKANNLNVNWKTPAATMENAVNNFKQTKAKTIIKTLLELQLNRFNRIRKDIVAPADKKRLLHLKDSNGSTMRTYHLQDRLININNLFINEENQYSSGADVDLDILPTSTVEVEWLSNPKRSRSERNNFFRYLTKADYDLDAFQVYPEDRLYSEDDEEDRETPCFLYALKQAGVDNTIVKQISQTMFKSGATVDFIRKTANAFNLYISVKQYRLKDTGRADNNISFYGVKAKDVIKLGSVGEHLFAIKPTKITKAALDKPECGPNDLGCGPNEVASRKTDPPSHGCGSKRLTQHMQIISTQIEVVVQSHSSFRYSPANQIETPTLDNINPDEFKAALDTKRKIKREREANVMKSMDSMLNKLEGRGLRGAGMRPLDGAKRKTNQTYNLNDIQGMATPSAYVYRKLGSKFIRLPDLDKRTLTIVQPNRKKVGPMREIGDALQAMIKDLVFRNDISQENYDKLSIDDKKLFKEILEMTHLQYNFDQHLEDPLESLRMEYDKLKGELMLGNTNPSILNQLKVDLLVKEVPSAGRPAVWASDLKPYSRKTVSTQTDASGDEWEKSKAGSGVWAYKKKNKSVKTFAL